MLTSVIFCIFWLSGMQPNTAADKTEIIYGQDPCDQCSMIINEPRFATAYVTKSGDVRRFDDLGGMLVYDHQNQEYLVEKDYALSLLPTSQLFNLKPANQSVKVLGAGISEALTVEEKQFAPISAEAELQQVKQLRIIPSAVICTVFV